jgi:tight adherence protein B
MTRDTALLIALVALAGLVAGALALTEARRSRRLRDRVLAAAGAPAATLAAPARSIRMAQSSHGAAQLRLLRLLRFDPEVPQARTIPWPVVAAIAAGCGALTAWRLAGQVGLPLAVPAGVAAALLAARAIFAWQFERYREAVFQQIPDALGTMVRAIRAGLPLAEALRGIARESPSPLREEFARVVGDIAIGRPVDAALMRLHARTGLTEFSFLAVTLGLQAQTGGSLSETLDTLADMVRKRVGMAKRARALAAEGRMQAGLLFVLPFIAAIAMSFLQPFYITTFTQNPTGQKMAMVGIGLMLLG